MNTGEVAELLSSIEDPELGLDIVSLGLVYGINIAEESVRVTLTTTSPLCPMGTAIAEAAEAALAERMPGHAVAVVIVNDPQWDVDMMSPMARMALGLPPRVRPAA
jgi:metal-sulfur cluster biosynthetic enzyme